MSGSKRTVRTEGSNKPTGGDANFLQVLLRLLYLNQVCTRRGGTRKHYACIGGGGGAYSVVARLSHLTIEHAPLSRRSAVPTPERDTSNS